MAVTKQDQQVQDIVSQFGTSNFADILNRLWLMGFKVDDLQPALATTSNGTNETSDIVTRLLNSGKITPDQFKAAATEQIPTIAANLYPFHPESKDAQGVVIPTIRDDYANAPGRSTYVPPPQPASIPATQPAPSIAPAAAPAAPKVTTVTAPGTPKPEAAPQTEQQIADYEARHYGDMLWVKNIPDLSKLIHDAATGQWDPTKFVAELHNTDWWKTNSDTQRQWAEDKSGDPETAKKRVNTNAGILKSWASTMGITIDDATAQSMGEDWIRFGWTDQELHQSILGHAATTDQGGTLGANATAIKAQGKNFLSNVSDDEAFGWAKQIAGGTMTMDNVNQALRARAVGAFPSIADYINNGGTPKDYFHQHIANASQLLEVDPSTIDLTDPKYNQIISYNDPATNKVRPMTLSESDRFIRSKDEYWTTENSQNEVSHMVENIGQIFGKTAV